MLLVSLLIGLLLLSIITAIICHIVAKKTWSDVLNTLQYIFLCASFALGFINIIMISPAVSVKIDEQVQYDKTLYTKEVLETRLEQYDNLLSGNEMLYSEITEFNNDLREVKYWSQNPWVNCYYNQKIAQEIDYIVIPGMENVKSDE